MSNGAQMDTDGYTGHPDLHKALKKRFRRAAEDFMRWNRENGIDYSADLNYNRMRAAFDAMEQAR